MALDAHSDFAECLENAKKAAEELGRATFNELDERFQLTPQHDPDHIFPEEHEMIAKLREKIHDLRWYPDKYIVVFLCARRHNLEETEQLIERFLAAKTQYGYRWKPPTVTDHPEVVAISQSRVAARLPGAHDKYGRMLVYYWMKNNHVDHNPTGRYAALTRWSFFEIEWLIFTESLCYLRNGLIWMMDFKDFSLMKNVDTSAEFRKWSEDIQGVLPNRIRGMYFFNAGIMIKAVVKGAKLVMPSKLSKRLHITEEKKLIDLIPKHQLASMYGGGEASYEWDDIFASVKEGEKIVQDYWRKVRHERRALKKELAKEIAEEEEKALHHDD